MSFYKHKGWLISLNKIRCVRAIRPTGVGGRPYQPSGKVTYEDGTEIDVPVELAEGIQAEIKTEKFGWIVSNTEGTRWRTWLNGFPEWTSNISEATQYHRRIDAEKVHQEDEDAWYVVPFA